MLPSLPLRRRRGRIGRIASGAASSCCPSLFTVANLFCGYACIVYAMRGDFDTAALFIGIAMVLDMLDGFIARLTNSTSAFGVQLDSLADVVSFGLAPAILAFAWGLWPLGRLGWAAGFLYVTAAAMRLARFNIQTRGGSDKRYFVGMPSPAAAGVIASTVFSIRTGCRIASRAAGAGDGARAGVPDGEHNPVPQLQDHRRRLAPVVLRAVSRRRLLALIATHPRWRSSSWPTCICRRPSSSWRTRGSGPGKRRHRQPNPDGRSLAFLTLDLDRPAAQLDVAARDRQAEAGPRRSWSRSRARRRAPAPRRPCRRRCRARSG